MKQSSSKIYKYDDYVISINIDNEEYIIVDEMDFYKLSEKDFYNNIDKTKLIESEVIRDNFSLFVTIILIIIIISTYYILNFNYVLLDKNIFSATMILFINIPIHEFGHILFLKIFLKESKIKVGFTFVFIYPAFYVDTSYSYLLPKWKRIIVYLGGTLLNSIFLILVLIFFPKFRDSLYLLYSNILINLLPIIKSDGYYVLTTILNKTNKDKGKIRMNIDSFIRGFIMFIVLNLISFLNSF